MPRILLYINLFLIFAVMASSCGPKVITPEEKLQNGKWTIHNVNDLQPRYGNNSIKNAYMEFNEDGTMKTKFGEHVETGTWSLNSEKTHIFMLGDSIHANGLRINDTFEFKFEDERTIIINNQGYQLEFRK